MPQSWLLSVTNNAPRPVEEQAAGPFTLFSFAAQLVPMRRHIGVETISRTTGPACQD
jgi:hypothetical protein